MSNSSQKATLRPKVSETEGRAPALWLGYAPTGGRVSLRHVEMRQRLLVTGRRADEMAALLAYAGREAGLRTIVLDLDGNISDRVSGYCESYDYTCFLYDAFQIEEDEATRHSQLSGGRIHRGARPELGGGGHNERRDAQARRGGHHGKPGRPLRGDRDGRGVQGVLRREAPGQDRGREVSRVGRERLSQVACCRSGAPSISFRSASYPAGDGDRGGRLRGEAPRCAARAPRRFPTW